MRRPELVVFDVNETLLSLAPIRRAMADVFGDDPPTGEWFARLLHGSLLANELDIHRPFGEIGADALMGLARRRGISIHRSAAIEIVALMASLPPHPDVVPAIERMASEGVRMITLTNGSGDVARSQVASAGIAGFLEAVLSVDAVGKFKPHPAPYRHAAEQAGVGVDEILMVAAHDWDCAGAIRTGASAIFVERPGAVWGLPSQAPGTVPDLEVLADRLVGSGTG